MNGTREHGEPTPAGRIAAALHLALNRLWEAHKRLPDYADLRQSLLVPLERELLLAELRGLGLQGEARRDARQREILKLLGP
jgi:hypothetical protein